jgi:hypothetical protein
VKKKVADCKKVPLQSHGLSGSTPAPHSKLPPSRNSNNLTTLPQSYLLSNCTSRSHGDHKRIPTRRNLPRYPQEILHRRPSRQRERQRHSNHRVPRGRRVIDHSIRYNPSPLSLDSNLKISRCTRISGIHAGEKRHVGQCQGIPPFSLFADRGN